MQIISFSGLDGSGKTEQINRLAEYLRRKEKRIRTIHIIHNSIANKLLPNKTAAKNSGRADAARTGIFTILLRKFALFADVLLFRLALFTYKRKTDVLVADRYFYDYLVNIYYLEKNRDPHLAPFLMHLIPAPDAAYYLKVSPETANKRKTDQGIEYLDEKQYLFEKLKHRFKLVEIGEGTTDAVGKEIIRHYEHLPKIHR